MVTSSLLGATALGTGQLGQRGDAPVRAPNCGGLPDQTHAVADPAQHSANQRRSDATGGVMATNRPKEAVRRNIAKARQAQKVPRQRYDVGVSAGDWRDLAKGGNDRKR